MISFTLAVRILFSENVKFSGKIKPIISLESDKVPPSKASPSFNYPYIFFISDITKVLWVLPILSTDPNLLNTKS